LKSVDFALVSIHFDVGEKYYLERMSPETLERSLTREKHPPRMKMILEVYILKRRIEKNQALLEKTQKEIDPELLEKIEKIMAYMDVMMVRNPKNIQKDEVIKVQEFLYQLGYYS
jgi:AraC-like DNA-binding protein